MRPYNQKYEYLLNPNICFPKSCYKYSNECYKSVLQPSTCSITNGNMCYQDDEGKGKCCAPNVNKMCSANNELPCRLSEKDLHHLLQ